MNVTARMELRFQPSEKKLVERAAAVKGMTVSAFVRSTTLEAAKELVPQDDVVLLSARDFANLMKAMDRPFKPNRRLARALAKAKKMGL